MDAARATSALAGTRFSRFRWVDETGSTNADLLAAAREGAGEQVLGAEFQSAGRGRLGRTWEAPAGASLLCSVLVRPAPAIGDPHLVTTALALSAAEAVEEVADIGLGIKWPNDLVAGTADAPDDRKVAGVLAETTIVDGAVDAVVVGIGINVNWPEVLPADLAATATSLRHLLGAAVDRTDLVVAMLQRLADHLAEPAMIRDAVVGRSATVGRVVRVERRQDEVVGVAVGLGPGGQLLVEVGGSYGGDGGEVVEISVGDVIHLRPQDS